LGSWWALVHRARRGGKASASTLVWLGFPGAAALLGWMWLGNDNMAGSWATIPGVAFLLPLLAPVAVDARSLKTQPTARSEEHPAWSYATLTPFPLHLLLPLLLFAVTRDPIIAVVFGLLFHPLYVAPSALNAWPWTAAGVMLGLAMAWSMLLTLPVAGGVVLAFVLPWLLADDTESKAVDWKQRRTHTRMVLWGSVILASLYLVLTWVLLLASIDAVNFEAHELYGAPFLAAVAVCFILYTRRHDDAKHTAAVLAAALLITVVGMTLFATNLGGDSATLVSGGPLTRGHLAWASLPTLTIALPLMVRETMDQIKKAGKKAPWKRIPVGAHIVHVGLLVLLLGHLSTTVLVDRGDASHRLTLIRDETVVHRGYGFEFTDLTLTDDDLEVGDGFVGVTIVVHEVKDDGTKEEIGTVHPGTLRFDRQGVARSEVDTLSGLTGDLVFIFDGSQSAALMQRVVSESTDAVDTVRVTVYVLPHSHAVWLGWVTMMFGMATITVAGFQNADSPASKPLNEEE